LETANLINTDSFAAQMRGRIINVADRTVLLSRIEGSEQETDLKVPPNSGGLGRIRHFTMETSQGWPFNPLPIVPAYKALGREVKRTIEAQVYQNNACGWRCWYCFVPYKLLAGNSKLGAWVTAEELVELYMATPDRASMIDLSGGSPDLTPEWIVWVMEALNKAGLSDSVYLWSDDNLSTDYTFTCLTEAQIETLRTHKNYGRVCCFKGFDEESFSFNTKSNPEGFAKQFDIFRRLHDLGLDLYGYATFTGPDVSKPALHVPRFIDDLQTIHPNLPLRIVPLEITTFGPTRERIRKSRNIPAKTALSVQEAAIAVWNEEIINRFSEVDRSLAITEVSLQ
jgi:uncharacterized Fe-S cluster-containing radical SAM superfamily protein